jgi:hypothetical protein
MNLPHDQFCVLPCVSLEASLIEIVRLFCFANDEIRNESWQHTLLELQQLC